MEWEDFSSLWPKLLLFSNQLFPVGFFQCSAEVNVKSPIQQSSDWLQCEHTVMLRLSFCWSCPQRAEWGPSSAPDCTWADPRCWQGHQDTRTPAECNSKQHEGLVACIAQITENKLQWAWTYIFLNRLRTSPGIAELSWNVSGRRRKRIWAGLARNFSLNHMARNCSMFLSWSLRIYFMHIIPWSSWCSIS